MAVRSQEIARILQQQISGQDLGTDTQNVGQVIEVGDGIARVWGLSDAVAGELLEFPGGPGEPSAPLSSGRTRRFRKAARSAGPVASLPCPSVTHSSAGW
jgi:hypothetical protein